MKWEPIETAPKDGTLIDVWVSEERVTDVRWMIMRQVEGWYCWATNEHGESRLILVEKEHGTPTHWMPLPPPP
jgi:hypothetical protein